MRLTSPAFIETLLDYDLTLLFPVTSWKSETHETPAPPVLTILMEEEQQEAVSPYHSTRAHMGELIELAAQAGAKQIVLDGDLSIPDPTSPIHLDWLYKKFQQRGELGLLPPSSLPDHDLILAGKLKQYSVIIDGKGALDIFKDPKVGLADFPWLSSHSSNYPLVYEERPSMPLVLASQLMSKPLAIFGGQKPPSPEERLNQGFFASHPLEIMLGGQLLPLTRFHSFLLASSSTPPSSVFTSTQLLSENAREDFLKVAGGAVVLIGSNQRNTLTHASALSALLTQTYLERPVWITSAEAALTFVLGAFALLCIGLLSPIKAIPLISGAIMVSLSTSGYFYFSKSTLLDPLYAVITALVCIVIAQAFYAVGKYRTLQELKRLLGSSLATKALGKLMLTNRTSLLDNRKEEVTVLRVGLSELSSLEKHLNASQLLVVSNTLLTMLGRCVQRFDGCVDTLRPCGLVGLWNAPLKDANHASLACRAALQMQQKLDLYNQRDMFHLKANGLDELKLAITISIYTGPAAVGNVGTMDRYKYGALGHIVEQTEDLISAESSLTGFSVVSERTRALAPELALLELPMRLMPIPLRQHLHYLLAGDASIAFSEKFLGQKMRHRALVEALKKGPQKDIREAIEICQAHSEGSLLAFYNALMETLGRDVMMTRKDLVLVK
ncbi:hypothetical protein [Flexibacterium corallicola]|uniref:hypothetical protein n=1 Tax=Flexibacterium corallicola TaxID=3037259 RepID=UPI00286F46C8|nr:hypothetical protein [Pseudovibrio sp. M1P-2-3]